MNPPSPMDNAFEILQRLAVEDPYRNLTPEGWRTIYGIEKPQQRTA